MLTLLKFLAQRTERIDVKNHHHTHTPQEEEKKTQEELHAIKRKDLIEGTDKFGEAKLRVEVKRIFEIFDGDASGQIGVEEFGDLLKELCIPMGRKETKALVKELDADGSGELDFEEFFDWYKDNFKEKKQGSFVEQMKLQAKSYVSQRMGSTSRMEAKRILISNETKDVIALARHEFRTIRKPQFECMECHEAFIDKNHKKLHDKNMEEIHEQHALLHKRATARHKLVDMARYRVTKGEAYPKFLVYPPDVPDHVELQVMDRPDLEVGRPLGVINHNTTVKALGRSGEKGTGDWFQIVYKSFEEAWVQEKSRRPLRIHLVPMNLGDDSDEAKEEKRKLKIALSGKTEEEYMQDAEHKSGDGDGEEEDDDDDDDDEEEEEEEKKEGDTASADGGKDDKSKKKKKQKKKSKKKKKKEEKDEVS